MNPRAESAQRRLLHAYSVYIVYRPFALPPDRHAFRLAILLSYGKPDGETYRQGADFASIP